MNHEVSNSSSKIDAKNLIENFQRVRQKTLEICSYIENEDFVVQPSPEVSPPKWHLGHTSWFFEEVILAKFQKNYVRFNAQYSALFNSYYKALGSHTLQENRGNLSRPTVAEVTRYRAYIDNQLQNYLTQNHLTSEILSLLETGIHHEQQHQELLYMDIKYILASNELATRYSPAVLQDAQPSTLGWTDFSEGIYEIGYDGIDFSYDNERPRHKSYVYPFSISQSLVTNGDFLEFIEDNGYSKARYWLSQGWDWVNQHKIQQPLYWLMVDGRWHEYTLYGLMPLDLNKPLVHVSYFEADAFANWKNLRLPSEQEFEVFLASSKISSIDNSEQIYHPNSALEATGQVWCWTKSQYSPYPRFKAFDGLLNEYNGKFMCNQFVLKGGCVVTPDNHYRHSYRNFYQAQQRWMFSGIRLAKDNH